MVAGRRHPGFLGQPLRAGRHRHHDTGRDHAHRRSALPGRLGLPRGIRHQPARISLNFKEKQAPWKGIAKSCPLGSMEVQTAPWRVLCMKTTAIALALDAYGLELRLWKEAGLREWGATFRDDRTIEHCRFEEDNLLMA